MYRFDGQGAENEIRLLTSFLLLSPCSHTRAIAMANNQILSLQNSKFEIQIQIAFSVGRQ
jgi:hypothetical protein